MCVVHNMKGEKRAAEQELSEAQAQQARLRRLMKAELAAALNRWKCRGDESMLRSAVLGRLRTPALGKAYRRWASVNDALRWWREHRPRARPDAARRGGGQREARAAAAAGCPRARGANGA